MSARLTLLRASVNVRMGEAAFQQWVMDVARAYGWRGYHNRVSWRVVMGVSKFDAFGWEDWAFWTPLTRPGPKKFMLRELKGYRGTLKPWQERVIAEHAAAGVDAKAWWPRDHDEVLATFAA